MSLSDLLLYHPRGLFAFMFPDNMLYAFSSLPCVLQVPSILLDLIAVRLECKVQITKFPMQFCAESCIHCSPFHPVQSHFSDAVHTSTVCFSKLSFNTVFSLPSRPSRYLLSHAYNTSVNPKVSGLSR